MNPSPQFRTIARLIFGLGLALATALGVAKAQGDALLNSPQVDQLLGPIALYPDPLIALILPASTNPSDIVLAARFLNGGGDPDQIDNQPWNDSVRGLARYPTVIKWMDENLTWTQQLGAAFLNQPDEVMSSVQRLRTRARATGALTSTPQQKLVLDGDAIEIVPAQPDIIYVPYYDPEIVYVRQPDYYYGGPFITFSAGLPIGFWLSYDFNWRTRAILIGDRHHNWRENRDWNRHTWSGGNQSHGEWHTWRAPANQPAFARPDSRRSRPEIVRPRPLPGAPSFTRDDHTRDWNRGRPEGSAQIDNRSRGPVPGADARTENRDRRTPPVVQNSRPESLPVPGNLSQVRTNGYQGAPVPSTGAAVQPDANRDYRNRRDNRDNRPTPQSGAPRPEHIVPVVTTQPQPVPPVNQHLARDQRVAPAQDIRVAPARDVRVPPEPSLRVAPARDVRVAPEPSARVAPSRPEQRAESRHGNPAPERQANPPPPRQATPPPPPPPPQDRPQDRDLRDKDRDVQR